MKRFISILVIFTFIASLIAAPQRSCAQEGLNLPLPGAMVNLSPAYVPVLIKGLKVHPENPLLFDFILDTGKSGLEVNSPQFKAESQKLIKYFLASLTIKEDDLWVNLSPYEKDRIVPDSLGKTELGRDMLEQDYILKQLTASLIYPEKQLGKEFWDRIYTKAQEMFGTSDIPVNTFNKVWIIADKAKVLERNNTGYVVGAHLKVMLEEDYLALKKHTSMSQTSSHAVASQVVREIIIPELEKEVNQGKNFVPLRQIFYSMILASWYKLALKDALLNQVYSNKDKTNGVLSDDPQVKEKIFQQYLKAYKKGVFNYIKEDLDTVSKQEVPRKYFSGGLQLIKDPAQLIAREQNFVPGDTLSVGDLAMLEVNMTTQTDQAMTKNGISDYKDDLYKARYYDHVLSEKYHGKLNQKEAKNGLIRMLTSRPSNVRVVAAGAILSNDKFFDKFTILNAENIIAGALRFTVVKGHAEERFWNQVFAAGYVLSDNYRSEKLIKLQFKAIRTLQELIEIPSGPLSNPVEGAAADMLLNNSKFFSDYFIEKANKRFEHSFKYEKSSFRPQNRFPNKFIIFYFIDRHLSRAIAADEAIKTNIVIKDHAMMQRSSNEDANNIVKIYEAENALKNIEKGLGYKDEIEKVEIYKKILVNELRKPDSEKSRYVQIYAATAILNNYKYFDQSIVLMAQGKILNILKSPKDDIKIRGSYFYLSLAWASGYVLSNNFKGFKKEDLQKKAIRNLKWLQNPFLPGEFGVIRDLVADIILNYHQSFNDYKILIDSDNRLKESPDAKKRIYSYRNRDYGVDFTLTFLNHLNRYEEFLKSPESFVHTAPVLYPSARRDILKRLNPHEDFAQTAMPPGGIDLNAKNMNLDIAKEGTGVDIKFDPATIAAFQSGDFSGIIPVIVHITPITSVLPILDLETTAPTHELAAVGE